MYLPQLNLPTMSAYCSIWLWAWKKGDNTTNQIIQTSLQEQKKKKKRFTKLRVEPEPAGMLHRCTWTAQETGLQSQSRQVSGKTYIKKYRFLVGDSELWRNENKKKWHKRMKNTNLATILAPSTERVSLTILTASSGFCKWSKLILKKNRLDWFLALTAITLNSCVITFLLRKKRRLCDA